MAQFRPTCRQCFLEKGLTILLIEGSNDEWHCPVNPRHTTIDDVQVA
ncbi:hypothetical protein H0N95_01800 [Candidatus Micrarchaeota archaeon]|nr:hypothetical protein [Candidatus Micrarchaeota archaeon]